jgi:hypothetical protein
VGGLHRLDAIGHRLPRLHLTDPSVRPGRRRDPAHIRRLPEVPLTKCRWNNASSVVDMSSTASPAARRTAKRLQLKGKRTAHAADTASDYASKTSDTPLWWTSKTPCRGLEITTARRAGPTAAFAEYSSGPACLLDSASVIVVTPAVQLAARKECARRSGLRPAPSCP